MSDSNTLLRVVLPSGNPAVYDVQPQYLNEQPGTTLAERARFFGKLVAAKIGGEWMLRGEVIRDPRAIYLLEHCREA
jgi:hypothetical protein